MAKDHLVRVVLDTGRDEGSRILALVDSDYAEYLAWYYKNDRQFHEAIVKLENKAYNAGKHEEAQKHREFYSALACGRILILERTFGRGNA